MHFIDAILSAFRWYRRFRGGVWYNVTPYFDWSIQAWVRKTYGNERINDTERH